MSQEQGASHNEQLLAAARDDNVDLLLEVFEKPSQFDINFQDGLGNTALHYACQYGSTEVLEHLLSYDNCDVDLQNRLDNDTPLLSAVKSHKLESEIREAVVESLLEAGADTKIKDKSGFSIKDLLSLKSNDANQRLLNAVRKAEAQSSISQADIAEDYDEEDDQNYGSGSGSEDE